MSATIQHPMILLLDWLIALLMSLRNRLDKSPYQGGRVLLPEEESLKVQSSLITLFGDTEAQILQKIREWTDYNTARGTHQHKGMTWTYGSYAFWHQKHFPHISQRTMENAFRKLRKEGVLIAERGLSFAGVNTAYRVNENVIQARVAAMEKASTGYGKTFHSTLKDVPQAMEKPAIHTIRNLQEKLNNLLAQEKQTTALPADGVIDFRADTGEHDTEGENPDDTSAVHELADNNAVTQYLIQAGVWEHAAPLLSVTMVQARRIVHHANANALGGGWIRAECETGQYKIRDTPNYDIEDRDYSGYAQYNPAYHKDKYSSGKWAELIER